MSQLIIDTHLHSWNLDRVAYPWLIPAFGPIARTFEPAELESQLAPAGVTHAVFVQAANSYADTEYMAEMAAAHPWISGAVGWVPLLFPHVAGRAIERLKGNPLFRGVRHLIHNEVDPKWLLQAEVIEGLKLLADAGLAFDVVRDPAGAYGMYPGRQREGAKSEDGDRPPGSTAHTQRAGAVG